MANADEQTNQQSTKLSSELMDLYDDFVNLNEECCFLFDAGAAMKLRGDLFYDESVGGYRLCANALKQRLQVFKQRLRKVHEKSLLTPEFGHDCP